MRDHSYPQQTRPARQERSATVRSGELERVPVVRLTNRSLSSGAVMLRRSRLNPSRTLSCQPPADSRQAPLGGMARR